MKSLPISVLLLLPALSVPPNSQGVASAPLGALLGAAAEYEVHEWGTFTSVLDSAGRTLAWNPFGFYAALPDFVHRSDTPKPSYFGTVRMETPVLYFYTSRSMTLDVHVGFPAGHLTEWYPRAEESEHALAWNGITLEPALEPVLPTGLTGEHYYAARGVAAVPVRASSGEEENFLFYRGVGSFEQPLAVRPGGGGRWFELENRGAQPISGVLLFENENGRVGFSAHGPLAAGASARLERATLADDASLAPLETLLRAHGLFADEARAMLATWRSDWFEPGLRVFYVLPREATDEVLPLTLTPRPRTLVRVLVGRLELFEPGLERELLEAARALSFGSAAPAQAFASLGERLTRFSLALFPAWKASEPGLQVGERKLQAWFQGRAR